MTAIKGNILLIFLCSIISACDKTVKEDWVLSGNLPGYAPVYFDRGSIKVEGNLRYVLIKDDYGNVKNSEHKYTITRAVFNCATKQERFLEIRNYEFDGSVTKESYTPPIWMDVDEKDGWKTAFTVSCQVS